jgi:anti-sigma28 factor (negative regulator of flagellin synthesis)
MADSITSASNTPANNSPSAPLNGSMSKASNSDRGSNVVSKSRPQAKISDMAQTARVEQVESVDSLRKLTEELHEAIAALNAALAKAPTKAIITHDD